MSPTAGNQFARPAASRGGAAWAACGTPRPLSPLHSSTILTQRSASPRPPTTITEPRRHRRSRHCHLRHKAPKRRQLAASCMSGHITWRCGLDCPTVPPPLGRHPVAAPSVTRRSATPRPRTTTAGRRRRCRSRRCRRRCCRQRRARWQQLQQERTTGRRPGWTCALRVGHAAHAAVQAAAPQTLQSRPLAASHTCRPPAGRRCGAAAQSQSGCPLTLQALVHVHLGRAKESTTRPSSIPHAGRRLAPGVAVPPP